MGVMPSNNLPPESQQWRRSIEKRLNDLTLSLGPATQSGRLNAALSARRVADGKNQIFPQSTPPVALALNDLWIDTGASNALKLWNGTDWVLAPLGTASLSATAIDGMTITGSTFQTTATPNRGVTLNSSGLTAWNSSGVQTVNISSATGGFTALGGTFTGSTVQTANLGSARMVLNTTGLTGRAFAGVEYLTVKLDTQGLTFYGEGAAEERYAVFDKSGFDISTGPGTPSVQAGPGNGLTVSDGEYNSAYITYSSLELEGTTQRFRVTLAANGIQAESSLIGTTTATSNSAIWVSGGIGYQLRRNTSLRKYKVAYEDATDHDLLKFRPRKWFDRSQVEDAGLDPATATAEECLAAGLKWVPGFIAEEVEEDDDLFATYDDQVLAGAAYDRFAVAAYGTLKKMDERLKKLEDND